MIYLECEFLDNLTFFAWNWATSYLKKNNEILNKNIEDSVDNDDRDNVNSVTSHIYLSNPILGNHWISFQGKYEKISEILCRVTWENIWMDSSLKIDGPSGMFENDKQIQIGDAGNNIAAHRAAIKQTRIQILPQAGLEPPQRRIERALHVRRKHAAILSRKTSQFKW